MREKNTINWIFDKIDEIELHIKDHKGYLYMKADFNAVRDYIEQSLKKYGLSSFNILIGRSNDFADIPLAFLINLRTFLQNLLITRYHYFIAPHREMGNLTFKFSKERAKILTYNSTQIVKVTFSEIIKFIDSSFEKLTLANITFPRTYVSITEISKDDSQKQKLGCTEKQISQYKNKKLHRRALSSSCLFMPSERVRFFQKKVASEISSKALEKKNGEIQQRQKSNEEIKKEI